MLLQCLYHFSIYLSAEELRGEVPVCSIWCRWKAKILVITPSPLVPLQLPFYLLLFLQSRACSSVGISVCRSSEQGSGPCQSHYITRPRYCGSAWPGWRDDYRGFVFPAFPSSSPLLLLLLPLRQAAYWCRIEGVCLQGTGEALWHGVRRNTPIASWMAGSSRLRQEFEVCHRSYSFMEMGSKGYVVICITACPGVLHQHVHWWQRRLKFIWGVLELCVKYLKVDRLSDSL